MSFDLWLLTCPLTYVQNNYEASHFTVLRSSQMRGSILTCDDATVDYQNQCFNTNIVKLIYQEYKAGLKGFGLAFLNNLF